MDELSRPITVRQIRFLVTQGIQWFAAGLPAATGGPDNDDLTAPVR